MFNLDALLADCAEAVRGDDPHRAVREVLDRAMSQPNQDNVVLERVRRF